MMKPGQRHTFEALVDALSVPSVLVLASHDDNRDMSVSKVITYRCSKTWYVPNQPIQLKIFIDKFLAHHKVL